MAERLPPVRPGVLDLPMNRADVSIYQRQGLGNHKGF